MSLLTMPPALGQDSVGNVLRQIGAKQVRAISFRSTLTPTVTVDPNAPRQARQQQAGGPLTDGLMSFIKPEIEVSTTFGPMRLAPWGSPTTNYFWPAVIGLGLLAVVGMGLSARCMRRR